MSAEELLARRLEKPDEWRRAFDGTRPDVSSPPVAILRELTPRLVDKGELSAFAARAATSDALERTAAASSFASSDIVSSGTSFLVFPRAPVEGAGLTITPSVSDLGFPEIDNLHCTIAIHNANQLLTLSKIAIEEGRLITVKASNVTDAASALIHDLGSDVATYARSFRKNKQVSFNLHEMVVRSILTT